MKLDKRVGTALLLALLIGAIIYFTDGEPPFEAYILSMLGVLVATLNAIRLDMKESNTHQKNQQGELQTGNKALRKIEAVLRNGFGETFRSKESNIASYHKKLYHYHLTETKTRGWR